MLRFYWKHICYLVNFPKVSLRLIVILLRHLLVKCMETFQILNFISDIVERNRCDFLQCVAPLEVKCMHCAHWGFEFDFLGFHRDCIWFHRRSFSGDQKKIGCLCTCGGFYKRMGRYLTIYLILWMQGDGVLMNVYCEAIRDNSKFSL